MTPNSQPRHDLTEYPIQENVRLEVYWRDDRAGRGPCASLYAGEVELLRFDCFDGDQGHCHVNIQTNSQRWYYRPGPVRQHIDQSAFDLSTNVPFAIRSHPDPEVRQLRVDPVKLRDAAGQMRERLIEFASQLGLG